MRSFQKSERIGKIDFLKHWNELRENEGIDLDQIPIWDEGIVNGGLDLAERVDFASLFNLRFNGRTLRQWGATTWPHLKYPTIFAEIREFNEKINYNKIFYDETGNIGVGYLFSQDLEGIMEPIHFTNQMKLDAIRVVNFLKDLGVLELEPDDPVIRQMEEQQKVISSAGFQKYEHPSGISDDRFWGLCLAAYGSVETVIGLPPVAMATYHEAEDMGESPDDIVETVMNNYKFNF